MNNNSPQLIPWLIKKMIPYLLFGAILGIIIGFCQSKSPNILRLLQIIGSVIFGIGFIIYFYWTFNRPNTGYKWSLPERFGIFLSSLGALLISTKLAIIDLPGPIWSYFLIYFILSFVLRPIFNEYGFNKYHSEKQKK